VSDALARGTGYRIVRAASNLDALPRGVARPPLDPLDRLLPAPVFLLSSVRSGSTLLRAVLDSHSQVHSPHETHFRRLQVVAKTPPVRQALEADDLNLVDLDHLLWDRLLHRSLQRSGKRILVEKTPSNVFIVDRLSTVWPAARFIFLIRHPLAIARSWSAADPAQRPMERAVSHTLAYMEHLQQARERFPGITVRYEDLTGDPVTETQRLCEFLGVEWESGMIEYGRAKHGRFEAGIGDWSERIHSGRIQAAAELPAAEDIPKPLVGIAAQWGYLA
jgi:Sulfotransferase domain.